MCVCVCESVRLHVCPRVCVCFLLELARRLSLCLGASHCFEQECGQHSTARDQSDVEKEFMTPFIWSQDGVLGERWGIAVNGPYWTLFREACVLALGDRDTAGETTPPCPRGDAGGPSQEEPQT